MISFNITYYNEPKWLNWWYEACKRVVDAGCDVRLNICDDGSVRDPAVEYFEKHTPLSCMRLFRVKEDIGFNSHGARNLLMKQTETEWNLLSDIDRRYPDATLIALTKADQGIFERGKYFAFKEKIRSSDDGFSVNEYIIHKDDFWLSGGYDEEFTNIHWGDRLFLQSLDYFLKRVCVNDWSVKYVRKARDVIWADVPTTIYPDDFTLIHPNNRWPDKKFRFDLKEFVHKRNKTHEGRMSKKVINFEWERVF